MYGRNDIHRAEPTPPRPRRLLPLKPEDQPATKGDIAEAVEVLKEIRSLLERVAAAVEKTP